LAALAPPSTVATRQQPADGNPAGQGSLFPGARPETLPGARAKPTSSSIPATRSAARRSTP
jgi:hypothetical protein